MSQIRDLFLFIILVAFLDLFVPFVFLKGLGSFFGSYLFWVLLTLVVLVYGRFKMKGWGRVR
ncbi:MAG: hypothetical protein BTN85_1114 [Candidatus Methanohalarchaeum thermophilum]|uniref:Uncharacterized protein n=1 Tax=Methanohalarchaeum thermophilum TaxID=1903181 RepID=A0A1Q6DW94_METT1|nr:MAG: hypothetical protein BTN85_1114 [Candidatus Methanohalarchaeum thermophilum]